MAALGNCLCIFAYLVANGKLIQEKDAGNGLKTSTWDLDFPCPSYLITFAVGDFECINDTPADGIPISYFAPKGFKPADIKLAFDKTPSMIVWLEVKFTNFKIT
jgi:aminopeptidase N